MPTKEEYAKRRDHYNEYQKKWASENRDKVRRKARDRQRLYREQAIKLYGGCCVCCGEKQYEFLAIDHIGGGGTKERKEKWPNSQSFYTWIKDHYEPERYRILCHNCNSSYGYYGYCPHTKEYKA